MKKLLFSGLSLGLLIFAAGSVSATMYSYDFELATPPEITGGTRTETQNYPDLFGDYFQRSGEKITLELHDLDSHSVINLAFDLAIIDSWDGDHYLYGEDYFNLKVDGILLINTLVWQDWNSANYWQDPSEIAAYPDSYQSYNITFYHSAPSVTIEWFADGTGWQGHKHIDDESFAIDNIRLSLHPVPEPGTMLLFGAGLAGLAAVGRRRKAE